MAKNDIKIITLLLFPTLSQIPNNTLGWYSQLTTPHILRDELGEVQRDAQEYSIKQKIRGTTSEGGGGWRSEVRIMGSVN